ncbi:MAG: hypothetical protein O2968_00165 [Acidobacteria bacterium]|nr:hypothetical protein [Acidobacteriota bacterium]
MSTGVSRSQDFPASGPPKAGPVETLALSEVKPGMQATAWTTFKGTVPEAVPVEVIGVLRNIWGPGQHIIMAKLGGKAARTNVAGGMSGSPVYYDGKLLGAVSLRFSTFSPDAIAGITPIDLILEINEFDQGRPVQASGGAGSGRASSGTRGAGSLELANTVSSTENLGLAEQVWSAQNAEFPADPYMMPIETPLTFAGLNAGALDMFSGFFRQSGVRVMQGGAVGASSAATSSDGVGSLNPGEPIAAVLVSGDSSASGLGTVTYNDGKRILAFGHPMFNMGPIEMPMATADVLTVLASQFQPVKFANSAEIVGALRQDRHSGIMGVLGETARMIPLHVHIKTFGDGDRLIKEKNLSFNVFQNQKWTPPLMMITIFNSMFGMNDFALESTFRLKGTIGLGGNQSIALETMRAANDSPVPAPLALAGWVGNKFQKLFTNSGEYPAFESVDLTIELLPERRLAVIEQVAVDARDVAPGDMVTGKVILRPYRGPRIIQPFELKVPPNAQKGPLRLLVTDAATLDRNRQAAVDRNRLLSLNETVSALNREPANNRLYITLMQPVVTAHLGVKTLPNVPLSVLNVMRNTSPDRLALEPQSVLAQTSMDLHSIVSGSHSITLQVK